MPYRKKIFAICLFSGHTLVVLFDLHVHSNYSPCSNMDLAQLVHCARNKGLDGICVTDHHTVAGAEQIREGKQDNGLVVIFGLEYTTGQGDFLLFGPGADIPTGLPALLVLQEVRARGGVAIAAHPCRRQREVCPEYLHPDYCLAMEVVNGRNSSQENSAAFALSAQTDLLLVGGSDAHCIEELGRVRTRLHRQVSDRHEFLACMKAGLFSLFSAPYMHLPRESFRSVHPVP